MITSREMASRVARALLGIRRPQRALVRSIGEALPFSVSTIVTKQSVARHQAAIFRKLDAMWADGGKGRAALLSALGNEEAVQHLTDVADLRGNTINGRIKASLDRLKNQVSREVARAVKGELTWAELNASLIDRLESNAPMRALSAFEAARGANVENLLELQSKKLEIVRVKIERGHTSADICDDYAGLYSIESVPLPPFHPYCRCVVVKP